MMQVRSYSGICFLVVCFISELFVVCAVKTLHIGGFFPLTGSSLRSVGASEAVLGVSHLAMSIVNNRSDILPGYQLQITWNDTKV